MQGGGGGLRREGGREGQDEGSGAKGPIASGGTNS